MIISERYASAINSSNLKSAETTTFSDADVLAAFAIADRRLANGMRSKHPLSVPLQRLFMGDSHAAREIVETMAGMLAGKARAMRLDITRVRCVDIAMAVLAWYRNPACKACGGHGKEIIPDTNCHGLVRCEPCEGTGKVLIERQFRQEYRDLVRWIVDRMAVEAGMAGPAALKAIAPTLNF